MNLADIPLFAMLQSRMGYLSDRQRVISENVANADSPGYTPHDLKPFSFEAHMQQAGSGVAMAGVQAVTQPGHMQAPGHQGGMGGARAIKSQDSEMTIDGNSVVLEDEMMKMTDSRVNYEAAVSFYQQSLQLLRDAIRKPGG